MKDPDRCSTGRVLSTFDSETGEGTRSRVEFNLRFGEVPARLVAVVDTSDLDMRSDRNEARRRAREKLDVPEPKLPPSLR